MATRLESGRILLNEVELRGFYGSCVVDLETGCWNWTGPPNAQGYGLFYFRLDDKPKQLPAYVVAYNHFVGAVPVGKELGHYNLSDETADKCAFYEHVRPVTHTENMAEAYGHAPGFCKYGHDTVRWGRDRNGGCNVCRRLQGARHTRHLRCQACGFGPCRCDRALT